jgi:hypothetical protein
MLDKMAMFLKSTLNFYPTSEPPQAQYTPDYQTLITTNKTTYFSTISKS